MCTEEKCVRNAFLVGYLRLLANDGEERQRRLEAAIASASRAFRCAAFDPNLK